MKRKVLTILSLVFLLLVIQSTVFAGEGNKTFMNGLKDYYNAEYSSAVESFDQLLKDGDGPEVDALFYQTLAFIKLNNIVKAKDNISRLEKMGYQFGLIYWQLGQVYLNKNSQFDSPFYSEAKKELERANMLGIDSPEFHSDLAMAYQGLGDLNSAAREYEQALAAAGKLGDYINLASLYKEEDQLDKALATYKRALKISPENTSIYMNMGSIYIQQKDFNSAVEILKKGVEFNPSFAALRYKLAEAYYLNKELDKASEEFNKVISSKPNSYRAYYYLGLIFVNREDWQKAIYNFKNAVNYNPDYVRAYIALGDIYLKQNNAYKAISQYTTAIEKNPNYPESHFHLALAYYKLDMKEAAISELRKTIHLDSNHQRAKDMLSKLLGE